MDFATAKRFEDTIPGLKASSRGLEMSFDALRAVQRYMQVPESAVPRESPMEFSEAAVAEYKEKFAPVLREYQKEMVKFLVLRSYAINADPPRSGKSITTLAADCLLGSTKTLIMCPSIAKMVWATEIVKWHKLPSCILYGRGADEVREFCVECNGKGRIEAKTEFTTKKRGKLVTLPAGVITHCPACKGKNGQSYGVRIHKGAEAAYTALKDARFIICNYDLLIPQTIHDAAGKAGERADLPGWASVLSTLGCQRLIADEAHLLRGRATKASRGKTKRDNLMRVAAPIPYVWGLTGTPIYGRVADLWSMLDFITDHLFGAKCWTFDTHHCNGHKGEWAWENDGEDNIEELQSRLDTFMLKRDRRDIMPHMPPKTRQVIYIDADKKDFAKPKGTKSQSGLHAALRVTSALKEEIVVENVINECVSGAKVVVFSYLKESVEALAKALAKAGDKGEHSAALKKRNFRVWHVDGGTNVDHRFAQAEEYRKWNGAGVFVATINSVPVAISLKGACSVHFADLVFDPAALLQAEDRPYEDGIGGLTILYYVVKNTVDEHVVQLVLPKMETLENVAKESTAGDFKRAFRDGAVSPEAMMEEIWNRMEAAAL